MDQKIELSIDQLSQSIGWGGWMDWLNEAYISRYWLCRYRYSWIYIDTKNPQLQYDTRVKNVCWYNGTNDTLSARVCPWCDFIGQKRFISWPIKCIFSPLVSVVPLLVNALWSRVPPFGVRQRICYSDTRHVWTFIRCKIWMSSIQRWPWLISYPIERRYIDR